MNSLFFVITRDPTALHSIAPCGSALCSCALGSTGRGDRLIARVCGRSWAGLDRLLLFLHVSLSCRGRAFRSELDVGPTARCRTGRRSRPTAKPSDASSSRACSAESVRTIPGGRPGSKLSRPTRSLAARMYFASAIASGGAFAVVDKSTGRTIGSSRYWNLEPGAPHVRQLCACSFCHPSSLLSLPAKSAQIQQCFRRLCIRA